jgi:hypothetical protein
MTYPTFAPIWAEEDTYPDGITANKIRPDESLRDYGYAANAKPTAQELNWQLNNLYLQIQELKQQLATPSQTPINELKIIANDNRNPSVIYGYGTWVAYAQGRTLMGAGTGTDVNGLQRSFAGGATGGEYAHTQTVSEMPQHAHSMQFQYQGNDKASEGGALVPDREIAQGDIEGTDTRATNSTGGGQAFNIVSPYQVLYIWLRIS